MACVLMAVACAGLVPAHGQTCQQSPNNWIPAAGLNVVDCSVSMGEADPRKSDVSNLTNEQVYGWVSFGLKHYRCPDLDIVLVNPSGSKYLILSTGNGPTMPVDNNFTPSFADGPHPSISGCQGNCWGTYSPEGGSYDSNNPWPFASTAQPATSVNTLAALSAGDRTGCWTLLIYDRQGGEVAWQNEDGSTSTACSVGAIASFGVGFFVDPIEPVCDSIDFNNDGLFPDDGDLVDFTDALAGSSCPTCNDIDFNNDGLFPDDNDLVAFLAVLAGGSC
jgi:hypothetical protein